MVETVILEDTTRHKNNDVAEQLTKQPWNEIGSGSGNDLEVIVDQLTSILAMRLRELVVSRPLTKPMFLQSNGHLRGEVEKQLKCYVARIAGMYKDVHYHSIEHAFHVTMSVNRLLSMLLSRKDLEDGEKLQEYEPKSSRRVTMTHVPHGGVRFEPYSSEDKWVSDATFGISSDAMIRFALVFSALIHDVEHQGVPNSTLVEEEDHLAIIHNDVSVAEQNSLQVAFSLLAKEEFKVLKRAITPDKMERKKFRKRVIEIVLGTDISSPDRMQINRSKWKEAFEQDLDGDHWDNETEDSIGVESFADTLGVLGNHRQRQRYSMYANSRQLARSQSERFGIRQSLDFGGKMFEEYSSTNEGEMELRKHTLLDTMMNVADIAHTMQNFDDVFLKWNKRMYQEHLAAFRTERINWDPRIDWYGNQTWFYDAYVIPLAEKMATCGAFGSRSSIFLCFAMENKRRWQAEGKAITEQMIAGVDREE